ncbi:MAG: PAS domain S-box protein [Psychromonas sp.]|nr:PAS domain S-box protein [Alteromonadales bacterium]MCP5078067.1 PAS domain S-box protein [Psychromonas sp.]
MPNSLLKGKDITWDNQQVIVSKTDLKGRITYANRVFMKITGYHEEDLIGTQHNIIRHPLMPRGVFKYMWEQLKKGDEFFAFVVNSTAHNDHYWVFAHITPTKDVRGKVNGYYSVRRVMPKALKQTFIDLYSLLLATETGLNEKQATQASYDAFVNYLAENKIDYNLFIRQLYLEHA